MMLRLKISKIADNDKCNKYAFAPVGNEFIAVHTMSCDEFIVQKTDEYGHKNSASLGVIKTHVKIDNNEIIVDDLFGDNNYLSALEHICTLLGIGPYSNIFLHGIESQQKGLWCVKYQYAPLDITCEGKNKKKKFAIFAAKIDVLEKIIQKLNQA